MFFNIKLFLIIIQLLLSIHIFNSLRIKNGGIITILSADLSINKDPDDWFDTYLFLTLEKLNPAGIILEHYATDSVKNKLIEFKELLNINPIPIYKGIQVPLEKKNNKIMASQFTEGAEFILEMMKNTKGKVRLIAVGSLRNEALAFNLDSALFLNKIEYLYFAGGTTEGKFDTNVNRDTIAANIIINSKIPKIWIPCTQSLKQKLTGEQEASIKKCNSKICNFLSNMLSHWRIYRGEEFLERTQQKNKQGKNLWSIPAFIHASEMNGFDLEFQKGNMYFNSEDWTKFQIDSTGKDLILVNRNENAITSWITNKIINNKDLNN